MFGFTSSDEAPLSVAHSTDESQESAAFGQAPAAQVKPNLTDGLQKLSNLLAQRHYSVAVNEHASYPVAQLGKMASQVVTVFHDVHANGRVTTELGRKWLHGELPINAATMIDLSIPQLLIMLRRATQADPAGILEQEFSMTLSLAEQELQKVMV